MTIEQYDVNAFARWVKKKTRYTLTLSEGKYAEMYLAGERYPLVHMRKRQRIFVRGLLKEYEKEMQNGSVDKGEERQ